MSGDATFSGTTYQQRVIAYVGVHVLAEARLLWFDAEDDTPASVQGETAGPGDDCSASLRRTNRTVEIQAKHGLTGGAKLREAVTKISTNLRDATDPSTRVVVAVDPTASGTVREVARDLQRLRSGRVDNLKAETKALLELSADMARLLPRISIVTLDVDQDDGADAKHAILRLENVLEDPTRALTAWRLLVEDAGTLCACRLSRSRRDLVALLESHGIRAKPACPEAHRRLDVCRELLQSWRVSAARERLSSFEGDLRPEERNDPEVQYRFLHLSAQCSRLEDDLDRAVQLALRALDYKPDGLEAIRIAGYAHLQKADLVAAEKFANRAVSSHPNDPSAWVLKLHVDSARGLQSPAVPPRPVLGSALYRTAEAQAAQNAGEWQKTLELSSALLREGERSPDVLLLVAEALLHVSPSPTPDQLLSAIRYCSEVIDPLRSDDDPRMRRALQLRSGALCASGDTAAAQADADRLRELAGDDPDVLHNAAAIRYEAGDIEGALAVLQCGAADRDPGLLAIRSRFRSERHESVSARRDVESALARLTAHTPIAARLAVADALFAIGDEEGCRRILQESPATASENHLYHLLLGRLSFRQNKIDEGIVAYRAAAAALPQSQAGILVELAASLKAAGRAACAADILQELGEQSLSEHQQRLLAHCLLDANRLSEAQQLVDWHLKHGAPSPIWALSAAFEVARRSSDTEGGLRHLRSIVDQGAGGPESRLYLAGLLFEEDRAGEACQEVLTVLASEPLPALLRMQAAYLLARLGRGKEALEAAYLSYREARHDPRMHQGLMLISQSVRDTPQEVVVVAKDTYVRLRRGERVREYTILASGPIDPTRGELTVEQARQAGLLGKRVGELLKPPPSDFEGARWVVEEVLSASHHAVQDAYGHYEERFPDDSFIRSFPALTTDAVASVCPLIELAAQDKEREQHALRLYQEHGVPLGMLVRLLGGGLTDVMAKLTGSDGAPGLLAEWNEPARQHVSIRSALDAKAIVLARSSIAHAHRLRILNLVADSYDLIAPKSLFRSLLEEAREAEAWVANGRGALDSGETGLTFRRLEAGHPHLIAHRDGLRELIDWCKTKVRFLPRPLDCLSPDDEGEDSPREMFGYESWDALELAHQHKTALYADDLGLRRLEYQGASTVSSFSTAALLCALGQKGTISPVERDRLLVDLVLHSYLWIPVSSDLLRGVFERGAELTRAQIGRVCGVLASLPTIGEAIAVASKAVKAAAMLPVQILPLGHVVGLVLQGMLPRWPAPLIAQQFRGAVASEFLLMPTQLRTIEIACAAFVRQHTRPPIIRPS